MLVQTYWSSECSGWSHSWSGKIACVEVLRMYVSKSDTVAIKVVLATEYAYQRI